jgi:hypothetical protein
MEMKTEFEEDRWERQDVFSWFLNTPHHRTLKNREMQADDSRHLGYSIGGRQ